MVKSLSASSGLILSSIDLHCLVEFILDDLTRRWFDIIESYGRFFRCSLRLKPLTLG